MTMRMPAASAVATASGTSGRGGSQNNARPSSDKCLFGFALAPGTASTRNPSRAYASAFSRPGLAVVGRQRAAVEEHLRRPLEVAHQPPVLVHGDAGELPGAVEGPLTRRPGVLAQLRDIHAVCGGIAQQAELERIARTGRQVGIVGQHDGR